MIAEKLEYWYKTYKYSHSKQNILIYVCQPEHFYSDWHEDGSILVVQYRPEMAEKEAYYVLHMINVSDDGFINHLDISNHSDRLAKPVVPKK